MAPECNALEPPGLHVGRDHIVVHIRKAMACEGGIAHEVRIVEDSGPSTRTSKRRPFSSKFHA